MGNAYQVVKGKHVKRKKKKLTNTTGKPKKERGTTFVLSFLLVDHGWFVSCDLCVVAVVATVVIIPVSSEGGPRVDGLTDCGFSVRVLLCLCLCVAYLAAGVRVCPLPRLFPFSIAVSTHRALAINSKVGTRVSVTVQNSKIGLGTIQQRTNIRFLSIYVKTGSHI